MTTSRLVTQLAEGMLFGVDPAYMLRVSDPLEQGILEKSIAEAVRLREIMDNNLAVAIIRTLSEAM